MSTSPQSIIKCPGCDARYDVTRERPGRRFACTRCGADIKVPGTGTRAGKPVPTMPAAPKPQEVPLDQADPLVGRRLGHYELISVIGRGGFATVYKARDVDRGRAAAVKVLHMNTEEQIARFEREAGVLRGLMQVNHPNIPEIYDYARDNGRIYMAMEYLEGRPLSKIIRSERESTAGRPLSPARAVWIACQVCSALTVMHEHEKRIIHRDLSAANILLADKPGDPDHVYVLDFGIARLKDSAADGLTRGAFVGNYDYAPPEQIERPPGQEIDHRADLFSLGVVLYEMLTGARPFHGTTTFQQANLILRAAPRSFRKINRSLHVPPLLEATVFKCLEKKRERRPQSARELAQELRNAVRPSQRTSRGRVAAAVAVLLVAALAAAAVAFQPRLAARVVAPLESRLKQATRGPKIDWQAVDAAAQYPGWYRWACFSTQKPASLLVALDLYRDLRRRPAAEALPEFRHAVGLLGEQRHQEALRELRQVSAGLSGKAMAAEHVALARLAAADARDQVDALREVLSKSPAAGAAHRKGAKALELADRARRKLNPESPSFSKDSKKLRNQYNAVRTDFREAARLSFRALHPDLSVKLATPSTFADGMMELYRAWLAHPTNPDVELLLKKHDAAPGAEMALISSARLIHGAHGSADAYPLDASARAAIGRLDKAVTLCRDLAKSPALAAPAGAMTALALERRAAARLKVASAEPAHGLKALLDAEGALASGRRNDLLVRTAGQAAAGYVNTLGAQMAAGRKSFVIERLSQDAAALDGSTGAAARKRLGQALRQSRHLATIDDDREVRKAWLNAVKQRLTPAGMRRIGKGPFVIGVNPGFNDPENDAYDGKPRVIAEYYIDAHEVTNARFKRFVAAGAYSQERFWPEAGRDRVALSAFRGQPQSWVGEDYPAGAADHPVTGVSWYEAMAYCRWRSLAEGGDFRLPTEWQWERAAGWDPDRKVKRAYPWGNRWVDGCANLCPSGGRGAVSTGGKFSRDRSPAGCYDMSGNVREWTRNVFTLYQKKFKVEDPRLDGRHIAVRGGSFRMRYYDVKSTRRDAFLPATRASDMGFRCVWMPKRSSEKTGADTSH